MKNNDKIFENKIVYAMNNICLKIVYKIWELNHDTETLNKRIDFIHTIFYGKNYSERFCKYMGL